ncbi:hypothetical protein ACHAPI_010143 [Fusarium lateritium]
MKVAIIGLGGISKYLVEELPKQGIDIIAITRGRKSWADHIEQQISDYSEQSFHQLLQDCDGVISGITNYAPNFAEIHLAILKACKQSPRCKRFIPSAWAGNWEEVPDQPIYAGKDLEIIYDSLSEQNDVSWTMVCQGWMMDYILPASQRHFVDFGERWVQSYDSKTFRLYGNGSQKVDFTSARDTARAVAVLMRHPREEWEPTTCISGQTMTWRQLWDFIEAREPGYKVAKKSLADSIKQMIANENETQVAAAMYEIMGHSEALAFSEGKVARHREKFFKDLKFRNIQEVYDEAVANPKQVI